VGGGRLAGEKDLMQRIQTTLGATARAKGGNATSFAVPWPTDVEVVDGGMAEELSMELDPSRPKFAQIDIQIHPSPTSLNWTLFHHAHGDLWNIIGSGIRKLGLTVNETGLHLRIEEIELVDRKKSLLFLTADPDAILRFLGLREEVYWREFDGRWALFRFVAEGRFFWVDDGEGLNGKEEDEEGRERGNAVLTTEQTLLATSKKKLKHNDRKRMAQRPLFAAWIEEFLPWARQQTPSLYPTTPLAREDVKEIAFSTFGPGVREEFSVRVKAWRSDRQNDDVWRRLIKGGVPVDVDGGPEFRAAAVRGLKRLIFPEAGSMASGSTETGIEKGGVEITKPFRNEDGTFDMEAVEEFVRVNWRRVGEVEMRYLRERSEMRMREKMEQRENKNGKVAVAPAGTTEGGE